jgi:hypothetical protein
MCRAKSPQYRSIAPGLVRPELRVRVQHLKAKGTLRHATVKGRVTHQERCDCCRKVTPYPVDPVIACCVKAQGRSISRTAFRGREHDPGQQDAVGMAPEPLA